MKNRLFTLLLALFAIIGFAFADESGQCGDNLTWSYNSSTKELTITGSGPMNPSHVYNLAVAPWYSFREEIQSLILPDGLTTIGDAMFTYCTSLKSVSIPNSVKKIEGSAFYGSSSLKNVVFPENLDTLDTWAFMKCTSLESVSISKPLSRIGFEVFKGCTGLKEVFWNVNLAQKQDIFSDCPNVSSLVFGDEVEAIPASFCAGMSKLASINIPDKVNYIGEGAFSGCSGLKSVNIPSKLTSISNSVFAECSGLESITIPENVTSIGKEAFYGCSGLTSFNIGPQVDFLGDYFLGGCTNVSQIVVDPANKNYDSRDNCNAIILTQTNVLHTGCKSTVIPKSVVKIGYSAFLGCTGLTDLVIPEGVSIISLSAFADCSGLTNLIIPNSVNYIENSAFSGCSNLKSVILGNGLKEIFNAVFYECSSLQSITCYSMEPPWIRGGNGSFANLPSSTIVYVPNEHVDAYAANGGWGFYDVRPLYADSVETDSMTVIPHYTTADVIWPAVTDAVLYEMIVASEEDTVSTSVFNAKGALMSIVFRAPAMKSRNAVASQQGFLYTVTGLDTESMYTLTISAKDAEGNVISTFSQDFTTLITALEDVSGENTNLKPQKLLEDGRIVIIMPDGQKFDAAGRRLDR